MFGETGSPVPYQNFYNMYINSSEHKDQNDVKKKFKCDITLFESFIEHFIKEK